MTESKVKNWKERITAMEEMLAEAACGEFGSELDIDTDNADELTSLETGINVLVTDLVDEFNESKRKGEELEKLTAIQKQTIEELSTPISKIWDRVLVLPLIGALDTRRSQKLTESLLTEISSTQSKVAILDITGVPTVDSAVANHLLKTVASVKLLGAQCVITGIKPEVAQTIVHLGVDLGGVETLSNLAEGLKWAFTRLKLVVKQEAT